MKKLSFAQDDQSDLGLLRQGHVVAEIEWTVPEDLPVVDLIELYLEIEAGLSSDRGIVVQFLGASAGPGSAQVALDMAWAAVNILEKKILVLNCTQSSWTKPLTRQSSLDDDGAIDPTSFHDDLVKVVDTDMYMADLRGRRDRNPSCAKLDEIHPFLDEFRRHFDMVIMVAPPADSEPLGLVLAGHVDGNILVIEADQTRRSAAIRLREILARCRRPILGAVLHNRRDHGPHWMTRLL